MCINLNKEVNISVPLENQEMHELHILFPVKVITVLDSRQTATHTQLNDKRYICSYSDTVAEQMIQQS